MIIATSTGHHRTTQPHWTLNYTSYITCHSLSSPVNADHSTLQLLHNTANTSQQRPLVVLTTVFTDAFLNRISASLARLYLFHFRRGSVQP